MPRVTKQDFEAGLCAYARRLVRKDAVTLRFQTGAGHILYDLLAHWPLMEGEEESALRLCQLLTRQIYPLAARRLAQAVDVTVVFSSRRLPSPELPPKWASYIVLDIPQAQILSGYLMARHDPPVLFTQTQAPSISVTCAPLREGYHRLQDDKARRAHLHGSLFAWTRRTLEDFELLHLPPPDSNPTPAFNKRKAPVFELTANQKAALADEDSTIGAVVVQVMIRALELRLLTAVADQALRPDMRQRLRTLTQELHGLYALPLASTAVKKLEQVDIPALVVSTKKTPPLTLLVHPKPEQVSPALVEIPVAAVPLLTAEEKRSFDVVPSVVAATVVAKMLVDKPSVSPPVAMAPPLSQVISVMPSSFPAFAQPQVLPVPATVEQKVLQPLVVAPVIIAQPLYVVLPQGEPHRPAVSIPVESHAVATHVEVQPIVHPVASIRAEVPRVAPTFARAPKVEPTATKPSGRVPESKTVSSPLLDKKGESLQIAPSTVEIPQRLSVRKVAPDLAVEKKAVSPEAPVTSLPEGAKKAEPLVTARPTVAVDKKVSIEEKANAAPEWQAADTETTRWAAVDKKAELRLSKRPALETDRTVLRRNTDVERLERPEGQPFLAQGKITPDYGVERQVDILHGSRSSLHAAVLENKVVSHAPALSHAGTALPKGGVVPHAEGGLADVVAYAPFLQTRARPLSSEERPFLRMAQHHPSYDPLRKMDKKEALKKEPSAVEKPRPVPEVKKNLRVKPKPVLEEPTLTPSPFGRLLRKR